MSPGPKGIASSWPRKLLQATSATRPTEDHSSAKAICNSRRNYTLMPMVSFRRIIRFTKFGPPIIFFLELKSLCEMLGPQGIRFIDDKLVRIVASITASLKDVIVQNQDALERLKVDWDEESKCMEALRKLRGMLGRSAGTRGSFYQRPIGCIAGKDTTTRLITIGCILDFRRLLLEAVTAVSMI